jgi:hypothetical protein
MIKVLLGSRRRFLGTLAALGGGADDAPAPELIDNVVGTVDLLDPATNWRVGGPDGEHGCEMVFVRR